MDSKHCEFINVFSEFTDGVRWRGVLSSVKVRPLSASFDFKRNNMVEFTSDTHTHTHTLRNVRASLPGMGCSRDKAASTTVSSVYSMGYL